MKTVFKIVKKMVKWYGIVTIAILTFLGITDVSRYVYNNPGNSPIQNDTVILTEACNFWVNILKKRTES